MYLTILGEDAPRGSDKPVLVKALFEAIAKAKRGLQTDEVDEIERYVE